MDSTESRKTKADAARQIAEPARRAAQALLRECLKTQAERKRVAETLGKSLRTINSLIYEGKGGFDLMIAGLIVAYRLDENSLELFVESFNQFLRSEYTVSNLDKRWQALDKLMSEKEKERWIIVMETYARLLANEHLPKSE
ncbi:MAG: hypothetical protein ACOH5I_11955 [Oligoflexus sp.]